MLYYVLYSSLHFHLQKLLSKPGCHSTTAYFYATSTAWQTVGSLLFFYSPIQPYPPSPAVPCALISLSYGFLALAPPSVSAALPSSPSSRRRHHYLLLHWCDSTSSNRRTGHERRALLSSCGAWLEYGTYILIRVFWS